MMRINRNSAGLGRSLNLKGQAAALFFGNYEES